MSSIPPSLRSILMRPNDPDYIMGWPFDMKALPYITLDMLVDLEAVSVHTVQRAKDHFECYNSGRKVYTQAKEKELHRLQAAKEAGDGDAAADAQRNIQKYEEEVRRYPFNLTDLNRCTECLRRVREELARRTAPAPREPEGESAARRAGLHLLR